jgi:hypothetical protein
MIVVLGLTLLVCDQIRCLSDIVSFGRQLFVIAEGFRVLEHQIWLCCDMSVVDDSHSHSTKFG